MIDVRAINEMVQKEAIFVEKIRNEVNKVIVGQEQLIDRILIGILTGGHILVEGVPGLAKTLTVKTIAHTLNIEFKRIQFTPDLLPADLIGTIVYNHQTGEFTAKKGPIFSNIILADEINRAPAKVQSALLESMQEHQVTIGDTSYPLDEPFFVMATQNPIEQEGTYPLPEAQIDRFMLKIKVDYPTKDQEMTIMDRATESGILNPEPVINAKDILNVRKIINQIYVDEKIKEYILSIVFATRYPKEYGLESIADFIEYGASPRASIYLNLAARAHAFLHRRGYVTPEDIKAIGADVLRHRVILTYEAEAEELTSEDLVRRTFEAIEVP
jgi:MoxR-like ATPase